MVVNHHTSSLLTFNLVFTGYLHTYIDDNIYDYNNY